MRDVVDGLIERNLAMIDDVAVLPKSTTARQFMQMVMRGEIEPTPRQMTAAKALIEYEEPRLSAVAVGHFEGKDFASQLERAILRSKAPYVPRPALLAPPEQHSADELKKPFTLPRRHFR
jgi:hypothetical protein